MGKSPGFATRVPTELGTPGAIDPDVECERLEDDMEPDRIDKVKTGNVIHGHLEVICRWVGFDFSPHGTDGGVSKHDIFL